MNNESFENIGPSLFYIDPIQQEILSNPLIVRTEGDQYIHDHKFFDKITVQNEIVINSESFSTTDGIIEQLSGNITADMLDYGNYALYNNGVGLRYKGIINKKQTDKFYVFHNQLNKPVTTLNLGAQDLGTLVVREPVDDNEVATKSYVNSHGGGSYLPLSGGTLSGDLTFDNGLDIVNLRNIKFSDNFIYNALYFPNNNRLAITSYNSDGSADQFMLFNNLSGQNHIEVMKDIQQHGNIEMKNSKTIKDLPNPVLSLDCCNKAYADTKLALNGGTISGNINMGNNDILNIDHLSINSGVIIEADSNSISYFRPFGTGVNSQIVAFTNSARNTTTMSIRGQEQLMDLHTNRIINVGPGTGVNDATNLSQLNTRLPTSGGTMTGLITFAPSVISAINLNGTNFIYNSPNPNNAGDVSNKAYTDTKLSLSGGTMSGGINMNNNNILMSSTTGVNSAQIQFPNDNRILTLANSDMVMYRGDDHYIAVGTAGPYVGSRLNLQNNKIIGLSNGTAGTDAINLNQLNTGLNSRLSTAGGLLTGELNMNGNKITSLGNPTNAGDAATKAYVDNNASAGTFRYVNKSFNALQFQDGGQTTLEIDFESIIPDGNYSFDISIYVKYNPDGIAADDFTFMTSPITNNAPFPFFLKSPLTMHHAFITPNNETYGTTNLKWTDIRTSSTNNTSFRVLFQYNGGTAWNFDINFRGVVTKIG